MTQRRIALALACAATLAACSDPDSFDARQFELAQEGAWQIPADVVAQADGYAIGYTGAGPWVGESGCSGRFTGGAQLLKDWVLANWPQATQVGGYSCRPIVGNSSQMSVHGTGRAIDIHIPLDGTQADNGLGDPLANYLVQNADKLGIQMVIWDRWLWSPSRSPRSRAYTGSHPHHDHLHVEITPEAARMELPWYQGNMTAPAAAACDAVPPEGRTIDDSDSCFVAFGPAQYWRTVSSMGVQGSMRWTNAWESANPSNWARWNLDIATPGDYVVEYYRHDAYARFDSTRYRVRAGGTESDVYLDQSAGADGWEEIGTFTFAAGGNQWVAVYDNADSAVPSDQHIMVDAIRVRPADAPAPAEDDVETPQTPSAPTGTDEPDAPGTPQTPQTPQTPVEQPPVDDLPPKGSFAPDEHHHDEPEIVFEDTPPSVHLDGHSCATTGPGRGSDAFWFVVALGVLVGRRRFRG